MATAEELVDQARAASTLAELDAIAAQAEGRKTVDDAVATRRTQLASGDQGQGQGQQQQPAAQPAQPARPTATAQQLAQVIERGLAATVEPPTGPNANTEPEDPAAHYFLSTNGKPINAFGEEKGSKEDKQRMASLGFAQPS